MTTTALERVSTAHAVAARAQSSSVSRKDFAEPPFWAMDRLHSAFRSSLPDRETLEHSFDGYAAGGGKASSIVFACFYTRLRHYAQARFRFENLDTGELSMAGQGDLALLDTPWPTGTTSDMLAWFEVDATFAGNSYWTWTDDEGRFGRRARGPSRRLTRMRPDWVWIIVGSNSGDPFALDAHIVSFVYWPRVIGGASAFGASDAQVTLLPSEVAHYAPIPDPQARFRGMSWMTPALREISADRGAVEHKKRVFEQGAALQTIVSLDKEIGTAAFDEFVARFRAEHEGADNAGRTLFVGGGADVTVSSANLSEIDFRNVTGGGETRIAADAGVHPVMVALSEGMQGASLNSGNFKAARRGTTDGTLEHLWTSTTSSLQNLIAVPARSRLWIHKASIPFLRDDAKDEAETQRIIAVALRQLLDAGYEPDAAVQYLRSNDLGKLVGRHSGLFSVQLQPPGTEREPAAGGGLASFDEAEMKELFRRWLSRNGHDERQLDDLAGAW